MTKFMDHRCNRSSKQPGKRKQQKPQCQPEKHCCIRTNFMHRLKSPGKTPEQPPQMPPLPAVGLSNVSTHVWLPPGLRDKAIPSAATFPLSKKGTRQIQAVQSIVPHNRKPASSESFQDSIEPFSPDIQYGNSSISPRTSLFLCTEAYAKTGGRSLRF